SARVASSASIGARTPTDAVTVSAPRAGTRSTSSASPGSARSAGSTPVRFIVGTIPSGQHEWPTSGGEGRWDEAVQSTPDGGTCGACRFRRGRRAPGVSPAGRAGAAAGTGLAGRTDQAAVLGLPAAAGTAPGPAAAGTAPDPAAAGTAPGPAAAGTAPDPAAAGTGRTVAR